ncbi:MAG: adenosine kinase [Alphaproteobacteria bacterium]|nr:adenosine kinase [Alphaproteobacteria bacterium]
MSNAPQFDLTTIGNALVDVLAPATEEFIESQAVHGMQKGGMTLIEEPRAVELYALMAPATEMSGGSAGNTIAGFASFGGKGAYIGKVAKDQLGDVFKHDMTAQGVHFDTTPLAMGAATGRCLILVTPDGNRTMNTFLGAAVEFSKDDVDDETVAASAVTYLEGYLFDKDLAKQAYRYASQVAHEAGKRVSLTLSDSFCVDRHRADFVDLVKNHTDILFANEAEIMSLFEVQDFDAAVKAVQGQCEIAAITRSEKGSVIVTKDGVVEIKAEPVAKVVDTTGAGDQYAAGFLYGFTQGMDLAACGRLGSLAAAEVIGHMGPRPAVAYADFLKKIAA